MRTIGLCVLAFVLAQANGCDLASQGTPSSSSGVSKITVAVKTGADGLTAEQRNIKQRVALENMPGSIKHLYVVSAMSGDCIIYSTVQGKVTSSGKRTTPYSVAATDGQYVDGALNGIPVNIGGRIHNTSEVLQDDGTYGSSAEYIYWFDLRGAFHQHYIAGGQIVHVSDKPMAWPKIILNLEAFD